MSPLIPNMTAPRATADPRIFQEQVHTQYQTFPVTLGGSVVAVVLFSIALTFWQPLWAVGLWFVAMFLQFGVRAMVTRRYHRRCQLGPLAAPEVRAWGRYSTWGSGLSGSLWGVMAWVFFPPTGSEFAQYQYLLMMMLSGMGTAAAFAQASYLPGFRAFMLPACVPFTILLFLQGTPLHTMYGAGSILYMLAIDRFVVILNGSILDAYRMRFANQDLAEQLAQQNETVRQASAAKSKFLASASHDLRQPLHAMELFAEALQHTSLPTASHRITEKLRKSVAAMRSLLDTLLDISKLDAGVIQPQPAPTGLARLLGLVHHEFSGLAQSKGLFLRLRVPPFAATHSDPVLLKSIVSNLVSNAVRYTERGGILITCRPWQGRWMLDVTDTGLGIPQAQQQEIFKEFVQLHNPQRDREQGLGLGLAIVGRLCGLLGHTVEVRSEPQRGSRFRVWMPQTTLPAAEEVSGLANAPAPLEHDALILVIDDERDVREAMHAMLTGWGLRCVCQPDAPLAVQALENEQSLPLLIISDYRLADQVNGIDAIEHVRNEYNCEDLPALLITGDTESKDLLKVQQSGIPVMHKPVDTRQLKALIQQLSWERSRQ
ncbi:MAG: two-component hybrid sensor and regulator [Comamonadaceae bacterium]|nr:MAG: two-component hybrid sensor and regulator [Comamonadaceae bacterium]